jgi:hypothetical protein
MISKMAKSRYLAAFFERYVADPVCFANAARSRSVFPSDNHAVSFRTVSPGLSNISRMTAHRPSDGQSREALRRAFLRFVQQSHAKLNNIERCRRSQARHPGHR